MQSKNLNDIRKEIRVMNNCKLSLLTNIDAVSGSDKIWQLWHRKYCELLNCVNSNVFKIDKIDNNANVSVTPHEGQEAKVTIDNK